MSTPSNSKSLISDSLTKSLSENKRRKEGDRNIGRTVTSSAKKSLLEKATIKFVKAERDANSMLQNLKNKYICLNPASSTTHSSMYACMPVAIFVSICPKRAFEMAVAAV